jgi:hypothetical protein
MGGGASGQVDVDLGDLQVAAGDNLGRAPSDGCEAAASST